MIYQLPIGARDLLPVDVLQTSWIEQRLQQVFTHWGYHQIITSTLERLDTLVAGGAVQPSSVIQLQGPEDEVLGLRPELTASIARTAATRMAGSSYPQRLCYSANVFRRASRASYDRQQEFYQAGVELLGVSSILADAEIVLLLTDCLHNLGITDWHLVLGEAGLTRSLLSNFPLPLRETVRRAIAHLDRVTLETLPITDELRQHALLLLDLRGSPADVLQQVAQLPLEPPQQEAVTNLKSLVDLLPSSQTSTITLDLSLVQTFDYYTGIVFEVVCHGTTSQWVLGQGGRYDRLLSLYHPQGKPCPGIGFSLNIDNIRQALIPSAQVPSHLPASDWLVVPLSPQAYGAAFRHAQQLRSASESVRVELHLDIDYDQQAIRTIAQQRLIQQIAWVKADGSVTTEVSGIPV